MSYDADAAELSVGQEVSVAGHRGTLHFLGEARFAPGLWAGIELVEARGKNDGAVKGVQYFSCPPNHGIFVRPKIVKPFVAENPSDAEAARGDGEEGSLEAIMAEAGGDDDGDEAAGSDEGDEALPVTATKSIRRFGVSAEAARRLAQAEDDGWVPPVYEKSPEQRDQLSQTFRTSHDSKLQMMFGGLPTETIDKVIDAMFLKKVEEGENIIEYGDCGDYFYIVRNGKFDIIANRVLKQADGDAPEEKRMVKVFEAGAGFAFGELALLYNAPRSATITAVKESEVWCLERRAFRMLVVSSSEEHFNERSEFLRKSDIFQELNSEQIAALAEVLEEEDFEEDEAILEQGDRDSKMYILRKGEAVACIRGDKGEVEVRKYTQGDYFGEIALLLGEPRKASVYAVGAASCMYISRDTFNRVLGPLRDFLQLNIGKYQKYQDAIASAEAGEVSAAPVAGEDGAEEVFEGGVIKEAHRTVNRKRDRSSAAPPEASSVKMSGKEQSDPSSQAEEPTSLADKIALDFKNDALVIPDPAFEAAKAKFQMFGGLRLGEKFKLDKVVITRTQVNLTSEGVEDNYAWTGPSWLKGATHIAVLCQKGQKSASDPTPNQDNFFVLHIGPLGIYGVCDGHGPFGHLVSFRLVQTLPHFLTSSPHFGKDWCAALKEAFLSAQQDLLDFCGEHNINVEASGAAGSVMVFEGPTIHVAHIGDAGAMVASWNRRDSHLIFGTKDHKPQLPEERARLEAAGSEVREVDEGSFRIYLPGTTFPGLTMSRAFGDTACGGVLQEPEYHTFFMQPTDEYYAIIASDGIWEFIEYENAVEITAKKLRLKGPRETVRFLTDASRKRWAHVCGEYCDDITALLVQWNVNEKNTEYNHTLSVTRHA